MVVVMVVGMVRMDVDVYVDVDARWRDGEMERRGVPVRWVHDR